MSVMIKRTMTFPCGFILTEEINDDSPIVAVSDIVSGLRPVNAGCPLHVTGSCIKNSPAMPPSAAG